MTIGAVCERLKASFRTSRSQDPLPRGGGLVTPQRARAAVPAVRRGRARAPRDDPAAPADEFLPLKVIARSSRSRRRPRRRRRARASRHRGGARPGILCERADIDRVWPASSRSTGCWRRAWRGERFTARPMPRSPRSASRWPGFGIAPRHLRTFRRPPTARPAARSTPTALAQPGHAAADARPPGARQLSALPASLYRLVLATEKRGNIR